MENPKAAVDAILENETELPGNVKIYELTIARFALCELVNCPFVTGNVTPSIADYVDTFYVMCNDVKTLSKYNSSNID